jgi:hypothetical protein
MTHPQDNSSVDNTINEIRAYEYNAGFNSRETEVQGLKDAISRQEKAFEEYKAKDPGGPHAATTPPTPEPEPPTTDDPDDAQCLIGMSAPSNLWSTRSREVEATGGQLEARRLFCSPMNQDKTDELEVCIVEGTVPVISYKPGPYTWAQIISGNADSTLKTQANRIKESWGNGRVYIVVSHEPAKQADSPETKGEAGAAKDFTPMLLKVKSVMKPILPNAEFGPIMNGWMWSAQSRGFSDADFENWLPKAKIGELDFIAADDYNSEGSSEKAIDRIKRRTAWMDRVGYKGYTGVGETNGWVPEDLNSVFNYAKTDPHFKGGFCLVWNSTGDAYRPLPETGLLDDFQKILVNW